MRRKSDVVSKLLARAPRNVAVGEALLRFWERAWLTGMCWEEAWPNERELLSDDLRSWGGNFEGYCSLIIEDLHEE